jgi:DNA-binding NarL/FixJ family response regulator
VGPHLDANGFHPGRSAERHLRALAQVNAIDRSRVATVLETVGLASVAAKRAGTFSQGMGQRLGIAAALLGDPSVLLFDEPINALDPDGIRWFRNLVRGLAAEGRTILLSSHLISEMALTADRLIVIGRGRLVAEMSMAELAARAPRFIRIRTPQPERFARVLRDAGMDASGLRAALTLRREHPDIGVLVFSQYVETLYATRLLAESSGGVGYLLKDRVADVSDFIDALERVAAGGTALDPRSWPSSSERAVAVACSMPRSPLARARCSRSWRKGAPTPGSPSDSSSEREPWRSTWRSSS